MGDFSPTLQDVSIKSEMFLDIDVGALEPEAFAILTRLVWQVATNMVWTYSPPEPDGRIINDDKQLARLTFVSNGKWKKHKLAILGFFYEDGDYLILDRDWISIKSGFIRPSIAASTRSEVMRRDSHTCVYCGDTSGPFDCDHIIPISRGGTTDAENLVCACSSCNRSKGAKTPEEWIK